VPGGSWSEILFHRVSQLAGGNLGWSADSRSVALSWLLKQHAAAVHAGTPSPLITCWQNVLPTHWDTPQLLMMKVKLLVSCLNSGIGSAWDVCQATCRACAASCSPAPLQGPPRQQANDQQVRAMMYAMRSLSGVCAGEGASAQQQQQLHATTCLIVSLVQVCVCVAACTRLWSCKRDCDRAGAGLL
jgi:hypothetical protein